MIAQRIFTLFMITGFLVCTAVAIHDIIRPEVLWPYNDYDFTGLSVGILFDTKVTPNPTIADLKKALENNEVFNEQMARQNLHDPNAHTTTDYDIYLVEHGSGKNPYLISDTDLVKDSGQGFGYLIKRKAQ